MFKAIKDFYLQHKYGYEKRPERLKLRGVVSIAPARFKHDEDKYVRASIIDISNSGSALETFTQFNIDDDVMLVFELREYYVYIPGKVVRRHQLPSTWVLGIKFDSAGTDKRHIHAVLNFAKAEIKKLQKEKH